MVKPIIKQIVAEQDIEYATKAFGAPVPPWAKHGNQTASAKIQALRRPNGLSSVSGASDPRVGRVANGDVGHLPSDIVHSIAY